MGDKWTTSGRWRLKSKQSRTFAARATQQNRRSSSVMIAAATNAKSGNPLVHPLLRKRNGGGKSVRQEGEPQNYPRCISVFYSISIYLKCYASLYIFV